MEDFIIEVRYLYFRLFKGANITILLCLSCPLPVASNAQNYPVLLHIWISL